MAWRVTRTPSFSTCLFTLTVSCSQQSSALSLAAEAAVAKAKQADEPKPTVTQDDYQILNVVLLDLFDFKDFEPSVPDRKDKTEIILNSTSSGASVRLSDT